MPCSHKDGDGEINCGCELPEDHDQDQEDDHQEVGEDHNKEDIFKIMTMMTTLWL